MLASCSTTILSSRGPVVQRDTLKCAYIKEWNIQGFRKDGKKVSCWCMMPPRVGNPGSYDFIISFKYTLDEVCDKNLSDKDLYKIFLNKK